MPPATFSLRELNTTTLEITFQNAITTVGDAGLSTKDALDILCIETPLWGMFSILIVLSTWIVVEGGCRTRSRCVMLIVTMIMYAASTIHWALRLRQTYGLPRALAREINLISSSSESCLDAIINNATCELFIYTSSASHGGPLSSCAPTILFTINMLLSDSIVLWRAWILWNENRFIQVLSVALLLTTFGLSVADISSAFPVFSGSVFEGTPVGLAVLSMSLATNIWATALVAHKAWSHRRELRKYVQGGSGRSQVEKVMALLVESGAIYCCIWIVLVAFNTIATEENDLLKLNRPSTSHRQAFVTTLEKFIEGGMFQVIGIYPTVIIILVGLHRTHCDRSFTYETQRVPQIPPRDVPVTVDAQTTTEDIAGVGDDSESDGVIDIRKMMGVKEDL
ncbi:hypothetical protein OF83DRAFT_770099 [Amylostereum chailletii]|nr:hypothetical protein OF83DRAFT_770099 [Amylostereum chailletii]